MTWNGFVRIFLWSPGFLLILTIATSTLFAGTVGDDTFSAVPELNPATLGSAVAFVAGGYLLLLSRFRRK
jgi:hypothetical protein